MTFEKIFNDYLDFVSTYRKKGTYIYYQKLFKSLLQVLKVLKNPTSDFIDKDFFDRLTKYYLTKTQKKNSQINATLSALMTALNHSNIKYPKRVKLRDDTKSFTALTDKEFQALLDHVSAMDIKSHGQYDNNLSWALSIYLFLDTGVRISELIKIRFNNIDFDNKIIYLDSTKNGYDRYVFYGDLSRKYLEIMYSLNHDHVLWNFTTHKPMDKNSIYHFFARLNKDLGFRHNIHPHRLRKTFATSLLHKGCNLATISKFLGHRDVKQTMVYLQMDNKLLIEEYAKYYPY